MSHVTDSDTSESNHQIRLIVSHVGVNHEITLSPTSTLGELQSELEDLTDIPPAYQKLMLPKYGVAKVEDAETRLVDILPSALASAKPIKLMLIGTKPALADIVKELAPRPSLTRQPRISPLGSGRSKRPLPDPESLEYTFHKLIPLPFLPNPDKSLAVLERLKADRGVKAVMKKYRWSVPVLTELDPASNSTHDSKLLGLNRNKGEVIELRLRMDDYDGWRDFKSVRKVLCHELAHNVHSGHDRPFWELTKTLEREVVELDPFGGGGHKLTNEEFYTPPDEEEIEDSGGWEGGSFVLGSGESDRDGNPGEITTDDVRRLSPRELMLRAAELRMNQKRLGGTSRPGQSAGRK
ncbi:WLM domain-containing protein [Lipomyces kononenkoae]|uniref:WLM domain-containing protein n=1 Tax=Lipomyces kononenkoae TaxID=34357 RepID=A0ACC3T7Z1_LIPKO